MNKATLKITITLGVFLSITALLHGILELTSGTKPIHSYFFNVIDDQFVSWKFGSLKAFSIFSTYRITALNTILLSITIIAFCIFGLPKMKRPTVLLVLFLALTVSGGGLIIIPFYLTAWGYATLTNKKLSKWNAYIPIKIQSAIKKLWPYSLIASIIFWSLAILIIIVGKYPGKNSEEELLSTLASYFFISFILIHASYLSGISYDIKREKNTN
jgi:hypothetical protein